MCPAASAKENVDARSKTCVSTVSLWTSQRATATELTLGNIKTHFSHFSHAKIFIVFNQANGNENRNCRYSMFHITNTTWSQKWSPYWCDVMYVYISEVRLLQILPSFWLGWRMWMFRCSFPYWSFFLEYRAQLILNILSLLVKKTHIGPSGMEEELSYKFSICEWNLVSVTH